MRVRALQSLVRDICRKTILPHYNNVTWRRKPDGSIVTEADIATQQYLTDSLPRLLPGPVLGEEMTQEEQNECWLQGTNGLWCIDPIDGTTNFANGIPFFAVSAAYLINHEPVLGLVYNPITDEAFYAAKGAGAYLNGTALPLRPAANSLTDSVAGIDLKRIPRTLATELARHPPYYSQRNFGSSALEWCFIAAARLDIYIHGGQMLWDYAAGKLILSEASGMAEAMDQRPLIAPPAEKRAVILAASPALFALWRQWLSHHYN